MTHYYKIMYGQSKNFATVTSEDRLAGLIETIQAKGYLVDSVLPTEGTKQLLATPST